jgi:parvulin-like peptidyl-prolyl isomerase
MFKILLSSIIIILFSVSAYADDVVVAKVNGATFTKKDLETEVDRLIPQATFHRKVTEEKRKLYYDKAIEALVNRELQYQDAVAKGVEVDKEKVNAQMENIRKRFTPEKYKAALEKDGITEEKLRAQVEKELLVQAINEKKETEARISEKDVKEYYEKNPAKFKQPDTVKLRIITTTDEKKAQDILAKIKAGEDFGDIAYKMSEDPYRVKGGDLGYMHKGMMIPEIEEAASKLKVGEVSDIVKVENAWFIIKLEDKKPEHMLSFEEIKGELKKELEKNRIQELKEAWITDLRAKAKIEVLLKTETESSTQK